MISKCFQSQLSLKEEPPSYRPSKSKPPSHEMYCKETCSVHKVGGEGEGKKPNSKIS